MNTDEIFKTSAKKQAEIIEHQQHHALAEKAHQLDQAKKAENNAAAIHARLWSGLNHLSAQEFPAVKENGYDIKHNFQFSRIPSAAIKQLNTVLHLYMNKGSVAERWGGDPPYQSDYQLSLIGDETAGTITAYFDSKVVSVKEQLAPPTSASELSDSDVCKIFQSFLTRSMKCEEERVGSKPPKPVHNRVGTPDGY